MVKEWFSWVDGMKTPKKKKMIILCYPNPRSSPTLNRYLGIQFVTFSFLYSHEYILSFSIGVFFWGGADKFSVLFCCALIGAFGGGGLRSLQIKQKGFCCGVILLLPHSHVLYSENSCHTHTHTHTFLHKINNFTNM